MSDSQPLGVRCPSVKMEDPPPPYCDFDPPPPTYSTATGLPTKVPLPSKSPFNTTVKIEEENVDLKKKICRCKTLITVYVVVGMIFVILLATGLLTGT